MHSPTGKNSNGDQWLARRLHDLRTPLNGILGFAALMHGGKAGELSAVQEEYLGDILTCARQMAQLINEIEVEARGGAPS